MVKLKLEDLEVLSTHFPNRKEVLEYYKMLERVLKIDDNSIVVDAGSHYGENIPYLSKKVGDGGRVLAFEPNPISYRRLKEFIRNNMISNVTLYNLALWNTYEALPLYTSSDNDASSLIKGFSKVTDDYYRIQSTSLDEIRVRDGYGRIEYIILNVEGAEINAIKGMKDTLDRNRCKICVAIHNTSNETIDLLESYGYHTCRVKGYSEWIYASKYKRKSKTI